MDDLNSINSDLDEFSQDYESKRDGDEDTEYEDEVIETNRRLGLPPNSSSRLSRLAGIQSRLTDPNNVGDANSGIEAISPSRRQTKAMQPSKMFETSPIISAAQTLQKTL